MNEEKKPKFVADCEACENETDVRVSYWDKATDRTIEVVEDDGALIIRKGGVRAVFNIDQDQPLREQNRRIIAVLTFLKMERYMTKHVLHADEDIEREEEEDEVCPHCGRSH